MNIKENVITTNDYVTKSNLPFCDYVINPYSGCTHAYDEIYNKGMEKYWKNLENEIIKYCADNKIKYTNAFYHKKLVKEKNKVE